MAGLEHGQADQPEHNQEGEDGECVFFQFGERQRHGGKAIGDRGKIESVG